MSERKNAVGRVGRLMVVIATVVAAAAAVAPAALAANGLEITTPYPSVSVAPGSDVSFDLTIKSTTERQVALAVSGVPTGWTATIRGGGFVVDGVQAGPKDDPDVRLDVKIPADAPSATTRMTVTATAAGASDQVPIAVTVDTAAAGSATMTADFAQLQGPSTQTFTFNLTLRNDTAQDLTFGLNAQGPAGWIVSASPTSQAQAQSVEVTAGSSQAIKVTADPPSDVAAGSYPLLVTASAGDIQTAGELTVDIIGQFELELTTPDGRLNANGSAGSAADMTLSLVNGGTAPLIDVKPTTSAPNGWEVTFEPETVASIEPGQSASVVAKITPSSAAVAGDYVVTMRASGTSADGQQTASADADIRFTVETSPLFLLIGIGLIVLVFVGLGVVFQRYGRR
ncbi:MAG TPA: NEW3 domain-containing protein [Candidatus Limnocylindrales bacterium]|nr:NEW3 domain-containing protein [Candidatus Limnocylindrales bacterium]